MSTKKDVSSQDKYTMFKNFMHNELGIGKGDIRDWIREAVREEVKILVDSTYENFNLKDIIKSEVISHDLWDGESLKSSIRREIVTELVKHLELKIKEKT